MMQLTDEAIEWWGQLYGHSTQAQPLLRIDYTLRGLADQQAWHVAGRVACKLRDVLDVLMEDAFTQLARLDGPAVTHPYKITHISVELVEEQT